MLLIADISYINLSYNSKTDQHYTGEHEHSLCITVKMAYRNTFKSPSLLNSALL